MAHSINYLTVNKSMKITEARFEGLSVVPSASIETWSNIPNFSIITGPNGSGKSRLLAYIINRIRIEQPNLTFYDDKVQFKGTKLLKEILRLTINDPVYFLNNFKWYIEPVTDCLDELSSFLDNRKHIEVKFNEIISHIQKNKD